MSTKIKFGRGRTEVTIEGPAAAELEAAVRDALGPVSDELDRQAARIHADEIEPNWPVKTGDSLSKWERVLRIQPESFEVEVVFSHPYRWVRYLRSTKVGERENATRVRSPLSTHVRTPVRAAKRELKKILPGLIARALESGAL
jgi:hypothetical protein